MTNAIFQKYIILVLELLCFCVSLLKCHWRWSPLMFLHNSRDVLAIMGNRVIDLPQNRTWTEQMRMVFVLMEANEKKNGRNVFSLNSCSICFLTMMKSSKSLVWLNYCASLVRIKYNNCFLNWLFKCSSLMWT